VFTRCTGCHTVHPVNAALLAVGGGRYRCGKCNKLNNALESLFDEWPAAGAQPTAAGDTPVLGDSLDLKGAAQARRDPTSAPSGEDGDEPAPRRGRAARWLLRAAWLGGAAAVVLVAAVQWSRFLGEPLLDGASIQSTLVRAGLRSPPPRAPSRDLERIHLVSRELRTHPTLPGRLRLSATLVNRANQSQPYPDIEVALLDAAGEVVLRTSFAPSDYLAPGASTEAGLAPQAYLPLVLDLQDPGVRAVGFELEFR
jgi:predicted Zn finger-like uncharacterized protein